MAQREGVVQGIEETLNESYFFWQVRPQNCKSLSSPLASSPRPPVHISFGCHPSVSAAHPPTVCPPAHRLTPRIHLLILFPCSLPQLPAVYLPLVQTAVREHTLHLQVTSCTTSRNGT